MYLMSLEGETPVPFTPVPFTPVLFTEQLASPPRTKQALIIKANGPTYVPAGMQATRECVQMLK